jgi:hypothetical protein
MRIRIEYSALRSAKSAAMKCRSRVKVPHKIHALMKNTNNIYAVVSHAIKHHVRA